MDDRPNILILTSHDTGRHFGCYGVDTVHSPAIDELAAAGCRFTDYFATGAVCAPSRGCMMTGRYPQANGLMEMPLSAICERPLLPWDWQYNQGERHLSHILRDAGYHTALVGFQHEAFDSSTLGFDSTHAEMIPWAVRHPAEVVADAAVELIKTRTGEGQPLYAQVGFFETHEPFGFEGTEPDASQGVSVPAFLAENESSVQKLAQLQGSIRRLDAAVGTILAGLESAGLAENTIVVFTVDHGIPFPRAKKFLYDPGIGVAFIMRWPAGGIAGGEACDWLVSNVDFVPTILELIGEPVPANVQGVSFAGAFASACGDMLRKPPKADRNVSPESRDAVFAMFMPQEIRCVRTRGHKLILNFAFRRPFHVPVDLANPKFERTKVPAVQLFDLERDPWEFHNVAQEPAYARVREDLTRRLWSWLEEVDDPILRGPSPTPHWSEAIAEFDRP